MASNATARGVLAAAAEGAEAAVGRRLGCRPDVLVAAGEEALAALAGYGRQAAAFDAARVVIIETPTGREGADEINDVGRGLARTFGFRVEPAMGGWSLTGTAPGATAAPALVAACGAEGFAAAGALTWRVNPGQLAELLRTGRFSLEVPPIYRVECEGELGKVVGPTDVGLYLAAQFGAGGAAGAVLEFAGPAVEGWDEYGRGALMEAAALCGPRAVYCAPATAADADASFRYDFSTLAPYYGAWTAAGFDAGPVSGKAAAYVDRVVIGPGLPAAEIRRAAAVVRGRRAHSDVVLWLVAPGAAGENARRDGSIAAWEGAGATAFLAGEAPWPEMLTSAGAVATTARAVFESCRDRGVPAYLVNPTTAAAAALAGELTDPTPLCGIISE